MTISENQRKPWKLVYFPPIGDTEPSEWKVGRGGVLGWRSANVREKQARESRRFTDAEFSAEYYRLLSLTLMNPENADHDYARELAILEHFIATPSIHEKLEV